MEIERFSSFPLAMQIMQMESKFDAHARERSRRDKIQNAQIDGCTPNHGHGRWSRKRTYVEFKNSDENNGGLLRSTSFKNAIGWGLRLFLKRKQIRADTFFCIVI